MQGHCEIDRHADLAYHAVHAPKETEVFYEDATTINTDTLPEFDLLTAGFPCQSFSIAGKRGGFTDPRGTMFFEIARILRARKPPFVLLENVPGLLSHDKGATFSTILATLSELGYSVEFQVLNSKDFGVAQSRRRVFIVGYLDSRCTGKILPIIGTNTKTLVQLKGGIQGSRIYDADGLSTTLLSKSGGLGGKTGLYFIDLCKNAAKITPHSRCITARYDHGISNRKAESSGVFKAHAVLTPERETVRQQGRRIKSAEEPMFTLTAQDKHGVLLIKEATKKGYKPASVGDSVDLSFADSNTRRGRVGNNIAHTLDTGSTQGVVTMHGRIRRLMPRECLRLQGFDENQIDRILAVSSDAQAYKQAGNAVTANVVHALGLRIKAAHKANVAATTPKEKGYAMT